MKFIIAVVLVSKVFSIRLHSSVPILERDLVNVAVSRQTENYSRHKRYADNHDVLHINIQNTNLQRNFEVIKHRHKDTTIPLYVNGELSEVSYYPKVLTEFYQCVEKNCLFQTEQIADINDTSVSGKSVVLGTFYIDGKLHVLDASENGDHRITVPDTKSNILCDMLSDKTKIPDNKSFFHSVRKTRATGNFQVELLIVLDYSSYRFWLEENNGNNVKATEAIRQFYAFMIKGVDLRYQNMPGATFTIDVLHAGLYILDDETSASFIEDLKNCSSTTTRCTVDSDTVLSDFQNWKENTSSLPPHDHAMLFTRYDLTTTGNADATGYAYLNAICSKESVSVIEEDFNFISQTVAAHELGHSLSAVHDGIQNACVEGDYNIMAATSSAHTGTTASNPWIFSTCSVQEINNRLNIISEESDNCLQRSVSSNHDDLNSYLSKNIGQNYTVDEQCQLAINNASYACREQYTTTESYENVCTGMWCTRSGQCSLILPAERTSCGNQKWCEGNQCVVSPEAPVVTETCVFGDRDGEVITGFTCAALISQNPYRCYETTVYQHCCQSCDRIKTTVAGCEFGDKTDCSSVTGIGCYTNEGTCCNTCRQFLTSITGCKYGDRAVNCGDVQFNYQCYGDTGNQCCQTCDQYKTTIAGCEYGDKATSCDRNQCSAYTESNRKLCCKTCEGIEADTTTTRTTLPTTTSQPSDDLPEWVIPVSAAGGALFLIVLITAVICCIRKSSQSSSQESHGARRSTNANHGYDRTNQLQNRNFPRDMAYRDNKNRPRMINHDDYRLQHQQRKTKPSQSRNYNQQRPSRGGQHYYNGGYNHY